MFALAMANQFGQSFWKLKMQQLSFGMLTLTRK